MWGRVFLILFSSIMMAWTFFVVAYLVTVAILIDQYGIDGPDIPEFPWAGAIVAISPVLGFAFGAWVALKRPTNCRRCGKCGKAVATPKDRQCFWCGFDWRKASASKLSDLRQ